MGHFRVIRILGRLLPFNSRASVRLRDHVERCEKCRGRLAGLDEARAATVAKPELSKARDLWPQIASKLRNQKRTGQVRRPTFGRRWALAAAGVLIVVLGGLLFILSPPKQTTVGPLVKLRVDSVMIYGQPAQAFVFQTQDADSTFVWVERQSPN